MSDRFNFSVRPTPRGGYRRMYLGKDGMPKWHKKDATRTSFSPGELKRAKKWADSNGYQYKSATVNRFDRVYGDRDGLHPELLEGLQNAAEDRGSYVYIRSGLRTYAEQKALYERSLNDPNAPRANRPGTSNHEDRDGDGDGTAVDANWGRVRNSLDLGRLKADRDLLAKYRLRVPYVSTEPWHIEL